MSDTRTDREELARVVYPHWDWWRNEHPDDEELKSELAHVDRILAWSNARRTPPAASIAVPHTPEEIKAAFDVWLDLDFMKPGDLEYTDDGVTHLASNVNITPDTEHMPDHLRPDIGEDRVDTLENP